MSLEKELKDFENEPEHIKTIVRNKPAANWEFLLATNLLESRLTDISKKYDALESRLQGERILINDVLSFIDQVTAINNKITEIVIDLSNSIGKDLQKSIEHPGKNGNAVEIKRVIDRVASGFDKFIAIETEIKLIDPPSRCRKLRKLMEGWTKIYLRTIMQWNDRLKYVAMDLASPHPKHKYDLSLTWTASPQCDLIVEENKKITKEYQKMTENIMRSQTRESINVSKSMITKSERKDRSGTNIRQSIGLIGRFMRIFK